MKNTFHACIHKICIILCILTLLIVLSGCSIYHAEIPEYTVTRVRNFNRDENEEQTEKTVYESDAKIAEELENKRKHIDQTGKTISEQANKITDELKDTMKRINEEALSK